MRLGGWQGCLVTPWWGAQGKQAADTCRTPNAGTPSLPKIHRSPWLWSLRAPVAHIPAPLPAARCPNLWSHNVQCQHPKENCTRTPHQPLYTKGEQSHAAFTHPYLSLERKQLSLPRLSEDSSPPQQPQAGSNLPCLHSAFIRAATPLFPFPSRRPKDEQV